MTINKSQGQTIKQVGLYLPKPVFTHGQLYVAISRVTSPDGLKILIEKIDGYENEYTKNIVYKEVFNNLHTRGRHLLKELHKDKQDWQIHVRITRMWDAVNIKSNNELISLELILLDEEGEHIQASIKKKSTHQFRALLEEGHVYVIKNFIVVDSKNEYRIVSDKYMINFHEITFVKEKMTESDEIGEHRFELIPFSILYNRVNNNKFLTDVIGQITAISAIEETQAKGKKVNKRVIELQDKRLKIMTMYYILKIDTNRNLSLSSTNATKFYVNLGIPEVLDFKKSVTDAKEILQSIELPRKSLAADRELVEKNKRMVQQILDFVKESKQKDSAFFCEATIIKVDSHYRWYYLSCNDCSKKCDPLSSYYWRLTCEKKVNFPQKRLQLEVEDHTASTNFVIFDKEAEDIIQQPVTQISIPEKKMRKSNSSYNDSHVLLGSCLPYSDMRKAISLDFQKKSNIPLKRYGTPHELEYD
ncbi:replication protein A 70 kDa DNA-binding subunit B-like [Tasmannia lanceolata]|uniref:replication protein A 70 kDa DNA-binding subunit B-like n=1 Tax=Tasmannia lanceolata TaxID=3420 RepID=UPI0040643255